MLWVRTSPLCYWVISPIMWASFHLPLCPWILMSSSPSRWYLCSPWTVSCCERLPTCTNLSKFCQNKAHVGYCHLIDITFCWISHQILKFTSYKLAPFSLVSEVILCIPDAVRLLMQLESRLSDSLDSRQGFPNFLSEFYILHTSGFTFLCL